MPARSPLKLAPPTTSPLSLATKKVSEWTAVLYSAASKEAEWRSKLNFLGTGIEGGGVWGRDVLEGGGQPLAKRGVSPARCCRRTSHSMNMDESSEKGDAAGKTPPPFKPMQA